MNAGFGRTMRRNPATLVVVVAVALSAMACFSAPERTALNARTPLREALRIRAERFMAGDLEGFLGYLSPVARQAEEPIARGAMAAELSRLEFVVAESEPDSAGGLERVEIEWVYNYRGIPDDNVFRFRRLYRTEARGQSVLIVDSTEDPASEPPLWATGPVSVARSPHFLALTRPSTGSTAEILAMAEDARAALLPKLEVEPLVPAAADVVVGTRDDEETGEYLRQPPEAGLLAVAKSETRPGGAENREMVVNIEAVLHSEPVTYEGRSDVVPVEVFRHELGHLVLAKFTGETTPSWVREGAAMYLSGERREDGWRKYVETNFKDLSFGRLRNQTGLDGYEYPYANAAVLYLVQQFDAKTFWEFYQSTRRTGVDVGLTRFFHTQDDRLDVLVQEWIRKEVAAG